MWGLDSAHQWSPAPQPSPDKELSKKKIELGLGASDERLEQGCWGRRGPRRE